MECDERVASEEVSNVACHRLLQPLHLQRGERRLVDLARHVVEPARPRCRRVRRPGNVGGDGVVAALGHATHPPAGHPRIGSGTLAGRAHLLRPPVVHCGGDRGPPGVAVYQAASQDRRRARERQHDGREGRELVVEVPRLFGVARLEGDLQAATTEAVRHGIHLDACLAGVGVREHSRADLLEVATPLPQAARHREEAGVLADAMVGH
mmetsp:Transcript_4847/g.14101  ORF Transcript_4847/g.14101 Transcript_4847/m.14101 type:complete len:209 (-) Transcript_4847:610-1236(-)